MSQVMNAFHPKYIETHMPEFLTKLRVESTLKTNGMKSGQLARASRESDGSAKTSPLSDFPKTKKIDLKPRDFKVYSRAGVN